MKTQTVLILGGSSGIKLAIYITDIRPGLVATILKRIPGFIYEKM